MVLTTAKSVLAGLARFVDSDDLKAGGSPKSNQIGTISIVNFVLRSVKWGLRLGLRLLKKALSKDRRRKIRWLAQQGARQQMPRRQQIEPLARGLNILGSFGAEAGLGEWTRSTVRASIAAKISTNLVDCPVLGDVRTNETAFAGTPNSQAFDVTVFHFNPNHLFANIETISPHFSRCYNIGCWIWEVFELPEEWVPAFTPFHEIWTPTTFSRDAILAKTELPVTRIPISVAPEIPQGYDREKLGLPESGFVFITMADFYSCPERKNPLGVLEAYKKAFGSRPSGVYLVLKINNISYRPDIMEAIQKYLDEDSSIIPYFGYLDRPVLNALTNACDCLVSLHRAEGFGLPIAEAMFMGKPVVATGWSGNMDFMDSGNSLPVGYNIVEIEKDIPLTPYRRGYHWAEPDLDHAAETLQRVVANAELRSRIGARAMEHVRAHLSPLAIGELMKQRLKALGGRP